MSIQTTFHKDQYRDYKSPDICAICHAPAKGYVENICWTKTMGAAHAPKWYGRPWNVEDQLGRASWGSRAKLCKKHNQQRTAPKKHHKITPIDAGQMSFLDNDLTIAQYIKRAPKSKTWNCIADKFDSTCGMQDEDQWSLELLQNVFDEWLALEIDHPPKSHGFRNSPFCTRLEIGFEVATQIYLRSQNIEMSLDEIDIWFVDTYYDLRDDMQAHIRHTREHEASLLDQIFCGKQPTRRESSSDKLNRLRVRLGDSA